MKRSYIVFLVIAGVLILDQWLKIHIKLNFEYNQDVTLFGQEWARLHFVENEGMAFGITFNMKYGKLLLSLFRILMVGGLFWYLRELVRMAAPLGLVVSVSLIIAGAIGNIIDSAVYGVLFTESPYHGGLATWANAENAGYGTLLHGKVVDMLYFPIKYINFPDWFPLWGGESMLFFSPIFNIADAAISCGVFSIILFQRGFFKEMPLETPADITETENSVSDELADQTVDAADEAIEQPVAETMEEVPTETVEEPKTEENRPLG